MRVAKRYTGVVVEKGGRFWGVLYDDGHSRSEGFGPIESATIHNPEFCTKPTDVTYKDSPYVRELSTAVLRQVFKTVIYEVEGVPGESDVRP